LNTQKLVSNVEHEAQFIKNKNKDVETHYHRFSADTALFRAKRQNAAKQRLFARGITRSGQSRNTGHVSAE
jgi:hypothetical protein